MLNSQPFCTMQHWRGKFRDNKFVVHLYGGSPQQINRDVPQTDSLLPAGDRAGSGLVQTQSVKRLRCEV